METLDQLLQLRSLMVVLLRCRIAAVRSKEADCIVSPVIQKCVSVHLSGIHILIKFKNRHQLYGIDSQLLQIRNFFFQSGKGSLLTHTGRRVLRKSTHMELINHQLIQFFFRLRHGSPVEHIFYNSGMVMLLTLGSPDTLSCYCSCIGIQQNIVFVEQQPLFRIIGTVNPVGIFKILYLQTKNHHGIYVTDFIFLRKRQNSVGFFLSFPEQQKLTGGSSVSMDSKINAAGQRHGSKNIKHSRSDRKS